MTEAKWGAPTPVTGLDIAFGGDVKKLLPLMEEIPKEFKSFNNPWNTCFSTWFYTGLKHPKFTTRPGIEQAAAINHIKAVIVSFDCPHEQKEAGIAYLMSLWFEKVEWDGGSAQ